MTVLRPLQKFLNQISPFVNRILPHAFRSNNENSFQMQGDTRRREEKY